MEGLKKVQAIGRALDRVSSEYKEIVTDKLMEQADTIVSLNTSQLDKSKLSTGVDIRSFDVYDPTTQAYADYDGISRPKTPGSPITLNWFGDFHDRFFVERDADGDGIVISSTDWKTDILMDRFTDDIFGLTEKNMNIIRGIIKPRILETMKRIIHGSAN
jgi:hypothetical protein